jgi:hypothetical protein
MATSSSIQAQDVDDEMKKYRALEVGIRRLGTPIAPLLCWPGKAARDVEHKAALPDSVAREPTGTPRTWRGSAATVAAAAAAAQMRLQQVKLELDNLEDGNAVYKLIGPVLLKQDIDDAQQNVDKRIDFIKAEM